VTPTDLTWYARRLRQMSPVEVGWRTGDLVRQRLWAREQVQSWDGRGRPGGTSRRLTFGTPLPATARQAVPADVAAAVTEAADRMLAGDWDVLGVPRGDISDPDWFLDQVTGVRAPSSELAFRVPYRDEQRVGNVKSLWEVSRHHHLTLLASAWWLSGDERYAKVVDTQLRSWWSQNLFLSGVHWTSGIEVGIRLIGWTWIRRLLDEWSGVHDLFEANGQAVWQIWWHQRFLARFRSRGSSANNHAVAEAAGLVVATCAFPWYRESAAWRRQARTRLQADLARNTYPSGVNRELASDYHRFVAELSLVAAVEADAAGTPLSADTWERLGRALDVAAALLDARGRPPRQGDGDDGRVLLVDPPQHEHWLDLLGVGEALLGRAAWWPAGTASVQAAVLAALKGEPERVPHAETRPDDFADAGITILRTTPAESAPELWCRCDAGPHGFLSIAAHAHADSLALEVRFNGVDVLADPGTYCYHGGEQWRAYFRSTLGHNTLEVGGADQSVSGGPFLWSRHAGTERRAVSSDDDLTWWSALHTGYRRLSPPVGHGRTVCLDKRRRLLTVQDDVDVDGWVDVRLAWHLGPDVDADLNGVECRLSWDDAGTRRSGVLSLPEQLEWSAHRGGHAPPLGWYSPSFGVKVPTVALVGSGTVTRARLVTLVHVEES
jgi:hypothetical protein